MQIGFDAKRAFYNRSGLGNYSRNLIAAMLKIYPENDYYLYTPSLKKSISFFTGNAHIRTAGDRAGKIKQTIWRSYTLADEAYKTGIRVFHGLSNELPVNIHKKNLRTVVTVHDVIFMRHPEWYRPFDVFIYRKKFRYACKVADRIIAVSGQTRDDIVNYFGTDEKKIDVIYQGCNDIFKNELNNEERKKIKEKYNLPDKYLLYVGTVEERKNLLSVIKALHYRKIDLPLVVVGRHTGYFKEVMGFIRENSIKNITFLNEVNVPELPGIYQSASLFIYPSVFEGFGIPIIEAMYSKVPVITSTGSCFREAGGPGSVYIDPYSIEQIAEAIQKILYGSGVGEKMKTIGHQHVLQFSNERTAMNTFNVYKQLSDER